ncbi:fam-m protein [Plasmodium malariae]|uniref:Fam-m protein n=1 Tax=Plasmodium malariae TaxID=5858 RepID=A0A1D3JH02_PLAMA|nr:fam-m protein [Plasmodium malariae]XP_028858943.1 fam-m protein [Plasmodium malariae]SBT85457.1 fam-m protein [Plasmodium malariae]SBT85563.1 fam-m protein [Plasmodium malariae]
MNQKIMLFLFIKISTFILLTWVYDFYSELSTFNKIIDKNYNLSKKLDTRNYRLLAKYKLNSHSNNMCLKEIFEDNEENKQRDLSNNEKWIKEKNKQSSRNLLNKAQYYIEVIDYNNGMFDGKHFHFQKKWVKKRDFDTFIAKKKRIGDISLKKIKFRSYKFGFVIFFIFFLLGIGLPVSSAFNFSDGSDVGNTILSFLQSKLGLGSNGNAYILLFAVTFIMLAVLIIIAIYKILNNNEKYQKIKLMME